MLETFEKFEVRRAGVRLSGRRAGRGHPLLLLHGHPQTSAMWHRVAPRLAEEFTVVMMDLRGYGDSGRPEAGNDSRAYSKREMALDALAVMQQCGFVNFRVLAHDRGARVAHRLAVDHPQAVDRLMLLDIAPTLAMYEQTSLAFAQAYWHWFFLIQPPPLPEALIESDPVRYVRGVMGSRHAGLAPFAPEALAEYERCVAVPEAPVAFARITAPGRASTWTMIALIWPPACAWSDRCGSCGANTASLDAASTCWHCGASVHRESTVALCLAAITSPKKRRTCSPRKLSSF
jgi:pimeloyl-ACP methyl ester carboxylesterase